MDPEVEVDEEITIPGEIYPKITQQTAIKPVLPADKPRGPLTKSGQEAKAWARKYVDDPRWDKMVQFWIDNPEMMPPGVFSTIMFYRFGKPPQTVKVKGEIMARPYLGEDAANLAQRAKQLAQRLAQLSQGPEAARLIGSGSTEDDGVD